MDRPHGESVSGCGDCHGCDLAEALPDGVHGWKLAAIAAGIFLWPLLAAIAGAMLAGESQLAQLVGGVTGLAAGAGIAALLCRWLTRERGAAS